MAARGRRTWRLRATDDPTRTAGTSAHPPRISQPALTAPPYTINGETQVVHVLKGSIEMASPIAPRSCPPATLSRSQAASHTWNNASATGGAEAIWVLVPAPWSGKRVTRRCRSGIAVRAPRQSSIDAQKAHRCSRPRLTEPVVFGASDWTYSSARKRRQSGWPLLFGVPV